MEACKEVAERGHVYEFIEKSGEFEGKYVLVVSSNKRAYDKVISTIMLGDARVGVDVVGINFNGVRKYAHTGCITFTYREQLGRDVCRVSTKVMSEIDGQMLVQLGLENMDWIEERARAESYKELYLSLLDRTIGKEI